MFLLDEALSGLGLLGSAEAESSSRPINGVAKVVASDCTEQCLYHPAPPPYSLASANRPSAAVACATDSAVLSLLLLEIG